MKTGDYSMVGLIMAHANRIVTNNAAYLKSVCDVFTQDNPSSPLPPNAPYLDDLDIQALHRANGEGDNMRPTRIDRDMIINARCLVSQMLWEAVDRYSILKNVNADSSHLRELAEHIVVLSGYYSALCEAMDTQNFNWKGTIGYCDAEIRLLSQPKEKGYGPHRMVSISLDDDDLTLDV